MTWSYFFLVRIQIHCYVPVLLCNCFVWIQAVDYSFYTVVIILRSKTTILFLNVRANISRISSRGIVKALLALREIGLVSVGCLVDARKVEQQG